MKVITLATRFSTGGAQMNSLLVAHELQKRGHQVEAWFLIRAGEMSVPDGLSIRIFSNHAPSNPLSFLRMLLSFMRAIIASKPHALIGFHPLANVVGAISSIFRRRMRFIGTQRNPSLSQGKLLRWLESVIGSTPLYAANVAVTQAVLDTYYNYPKRYVQKLRVIHNGVPPLINLDTSKLESRQRIGLPPHTTIVGMLGRLAEQKNPLFALEVIAELPDIHIAYAGCGPLEPDLLRRAVDLSIEDRIHLVGEVHGENVTLFYKSLDVFLLPSHFEGFGRTLVEAMQLGTPILANHLPVTCEVVADAGILEPLATNRWSSAIRRILDDEQLRNGLISRGRARAYEFSLDAMISGYEKLLHSSNGP